MKSLSEGLNVSKVVSNPSCGYPFYLYFLCIFYNIVRDAYNSLLEGVGDKVDKTREDIQKMVDHISTNFTGEIPGVKVPGIPPNPKHKVFELTKYWNHDPWKAAWGGGKIKNYDSPILSLFMEDEFGQPVSDEVKEEVRGDLFGYWNDLYDTGKKLTNYKDLGLKRREDFRKTMESKFPWLCLCEGHWKVKQLWINYFSSWKKTRLPPTPDTKKPSPALTTSKAKLRSSYHWMTTRNPKPRLRSISHRIPWEMRPLEAPITGLQSTSHQMRTRLPPVPSEDAKTVSQTRVHQRGRRARARRS